MKARRLLRSAAVAATTLLAGSAAAQEVTLRVQHFLPAGAPSQKQLIEPWCAAVGEQSGGRIACQIYPSMQLGGAPPSLIDQVRDGVVDVVWTLPSYTPGRFPKISVFELPFMVTDAVGTTKAINDYYEAHAQGEFETVHPILFHVHARGVVHTKGRPVADAADFQGLKLRAPSREVGEMLSKLGAAPVFMPVPQTPEALSKGVIDGAVVPWEVTVSLKLAELTDNHLEIPGDRGLYAAVFLFAMNKAKFDGLPDDLKKVIDDNSGMAWAERIGQAWEDAEAPGLAAAKARGNTIVTMDEAEIAKLREAGNAVTEAWVANTQGGAELVKAAQELIDRHSAAN